MNAFQPEAPECIDLGRADRPVAAEGDDDVEPVVRSRLVQRLLQARSEDHARKRGRRGEEAEGECGKLCAKPAGTECEHRALQRGEVVGT